MGEERHEHGRMFAFIVVIFVLLIIVGCSCAGIY